MRYMNTMEYYSAVKKNEGMGISGKLVELEIIMLSEAFQTQKDKGHMFAVICNS